MEQNGHDARALVGEPSLSLRLLVTDGWCHESPKELAYNGVEALTKAVDQPLTLEVEVGARSSAPPSLVPKLRPAVNL